MISYRSTAFRGSLACTCTYMYMHVHVLKMHITIKQRHGDMVIKSACPQCDDVSYHHMPHIYRVSCYLSIMLICYTRHWHAFNVRTTCMLEQLCTQWWVMTTTSRCFLPYVYMYRTQNAVKLNKSKYGYMYMYLFSLYYGYSYYSYVSPLFYH